MIALKVIRENTEKVRAVMKTRGANIDLDPVSYTHLTLPTNREV